MTSDFLALEAVNLSKLIKELDADAPVHDCKECPCDCQEWDFLDENSKSDIGVAF